MDKEKTLTLIRGLNCIKSVCQHTAYSTQCPIQIFEKGFICECADVVGTLNTLLCSVGAIKPPRLEILNLNGCESYKQSIQEQNIILETGGESSLSSQPYMDWVSKRTMFYEKIYTFIITHITNSISKHL